VEQWAAGFASAHGRLPLPLRDKRAYNKALYKFTCLLFYTRCLKTSLFIPAIIQQMWLQQTPTAHIVTVHQM